MLGRRWVVVMGLAVGSAALAQEKEYSGTVVSLNERTGKVEIKTPNSVGNWTVNHQTFVTTGSGHADVSALLFSQGVTAFVEPNGVIKRIVIHGMKPGWATGPNVGEVVSLNEREGRIVIRMPNSTGNWRVDRGTRVSFNMGPEPLSLLLSSQKVRVEVDRSGRVDAIQILQLR